MTNKLPQGWVECKLEELCKIISKGTTPKKQSGEFSFAKFLKAENITKELTIDLTNCKYIDKETHIGVLKRSILQKNDIVVTIAGTLGRCAVVETDENLNTNQAVCFARLMDNQISPHFIKWHIASPFVNLRLTKKAKVTAIPNLTLEIIKNININLPPLNEQKRIVEKIEEEFVKINQGIEKLKSAQEQIKQYRQAVLKSAFCNIKSYNFIKLKECTKKITDGSHNPPSKKLAGIPMLSGRNIKNNAIIFDEFRYISENEYINEYKRTPIETNDVLLTIVGTIGETAVVPKQIQKFAIQRSVALIKPQKINSYYLKYYLDSPFAINYFKTKEKGTAQKGIYLETLKNMDIKIPRNYNEQQKIVEEIEKRFLVANEVEKIITENLEKAEQLKQSILKKAFEGGLVPQDPNDEPASVLLEKIKAERGK